MSNTLQVTYTVTEAHMCALAQLVHRGSLETCAGQARFLQAIAPLVWPGLALRLTVGEGDPKGAEAPAVVRLVPSSEVPHGHS